MADKYVTINWQPVLIRLAASVNGCFLGESKGEVHIEIFYLQKREIMAREYFTWTDDESELLLNLTLEYKTEKSLDSIDWESIRSKYNDIHERFVAHLQSIAEGETPALDKEYPHRPEEISRGIVTSKLKGICGRYRKAVNTGCKSGQGRIVELYYTLCQEIWGGSPATEQIHSGLKSVDLITEGNEEEPSVSSTTSLKKPGNKGKNTKRGEIAPSTDTPGPSHVPDESGETAKRRKLLDSKLSNYKQKTSRKKLPVADTEEREFRSSILQQLEESDKAFTDSIQKMSNNMEKLSGAILSGFSMLQQVMIQPPPSMQPLPHPQQPVYYHHQDTHLQPPSRPRTPTNYPDVRLQPPSRPRMPTSYPDVHLQPPSRPSSPTIYPDKYNF